MTFFSCYIYSFQDKRPEVMVIHLRTLLKQKQVWLSQTLNFLLVPQGRHSNCKAKSSGHRLVNGHSVGKKSGSSQQSGAHLVDNPREGETRVICRLRKLPRGSSWQMLRDPSFLEVQGLFVNLKSQSLVHTALVTQTHPSHLLFTILGEVSQPFSFPHIHPDGSLTIRPMFAITRPVRVDPGLVHVTSILMNERKKKGNLLLRCS